MIEWAVEDTHLRVVDADNAEVYIRADPLEVSTDCAAIDRPVDETLAVTTTALRVPHAVVYAFSLAGPAWYQLAPDETTLSLPSSEYIVDIDTEVKLYLRFSGSATIQRTSDFSTLVISFDELTRVLVGVRSRHEFPAGTITVPETPDGIAAGITHLSSSHETDSPDRTYPTLRGHPPLLERGSRLSVPDAITPEVSGIELVVPPSYEALFTVAPLAYYLQATVRVEAGVEPHLWLPDVACEHTLSSMPALERAAARVLRQCFFLDCLVRNAGPYRTTLAELSLVDALELDIEHLYEQPIQERVATYLDVPYAGIEHRLPQWHLATYVEPTPAAVDALPFLLDRLSLIYTPEMSTLEGKELVERSLADFYRGGEAVRTHPRQGAGEVASVDIVKPHLKEGRVHGWLADGVPIDVFKLTTTAYRNRLEYLKRPTDSMSIGVVLNDPAMIGEQDRVAAIYRQRARALSMDVTVEENLTVAALASTLESDFDFLHYIGHCETDGLRCPDGYLTTSSLETCGVETFFLNACGSFYEGMELIERGSVAGAVTFTQVLNEHAIKVGSTFAKLLMHGFSIERAMRLARRRIMMGKDYAVVGDGTHSLTEGDLQLPTTVRVEPLEDGRYLLHLECYSTRVNGLYYIPHTAQNEYAYLSGTPSYFTLEQPQLVAFLREAEAAVIYDGDIYWSTEVLDELP